MVALIPDYKQISTKFQEFKRMVSENRAEMQGGFLVSNWFDNKHGTYWVNPRAVGEKLAEVIKIEGIRWPKQITTLLNFLDTCITGIKSRVILLSPDNGFGQRTSRTLKPESICKRNDITQQAEAIQFTKPHSFPAYFDKKLIQIPKFLVFRH